MTRKKTYYNTPPFKSDSPDYNIVCINKTQSGDTIKTERYYNGNLEFTRYEFTEGTATKEIMYTPENELIYSSVTLDLGNNRQLYITTDPEFQSTDSIYYDNDKEIKEIVTSPDSKSTRLYEYDKHGNLSKKLEYKTFKNHYLF